MVTISFLSTHTHYRILRRAGGTERSAGKVSKAYQVFQHILLNYNIYWATSLWQSMLLAFIWITLNPSEHFRSKRIMRFIFANVSENEDQYPRFVRPLFGRRTWADFAIRETLKESRGSLDGRFPRSDSCGRTARRNSNFTREPNGRRDLWAGRLACMPRARNELATLWSHKAKYF